jgi:hypothetical protein
LLTIKAIPLLHVPALCCCSWLLAGLLQSIVPVGCPCLKDAARLFSYTRPVWRLLVTSNASPAACVCLVLLQLAAGKVAAIQLLKDELMAAATAAFPDAAAVYT